MSRPQIFLLAVVSFSLLACHTDSVEPKQNKVDVRSGAQKSTSDVLMFSDLSVVGTSELIRTPNSIQMSLETSNLTDGDAVTVWYVIFNEPGECATSPCGEADIFDPNTKTDVVYAAGHVVGDGSNVTFAGHLSENDASGSIMGFFNELLGIDLPSWGLLDSYNAEIHYVVRTHQQAIPEFLPDMIQSFNGGCIYPVGISADYGEAGPNTCSDIQFSVHQP